MQDIAQVLRLVLKKKKREIKANYLLIFINNLWCFKHLNSM